jgi:hypothetical protein
MVINYHISNSQKSQSFRHIGKVKEGNAIPATVREIPQGSEPSRVPHSLDNRLTDGGKVSLTRRPTFTHQEDFWYSYLLEAESTPGS